MSKVENIKLTREEKQALQGILKDPKKKLEFYKKIKKIIEDYNLLKKKQEKVEKDNKKIAVLKHKIFKIK